MIVRCPLASFEAHELHFCTLPLPQTPHVIILDGELASLTATGSLDSQAVLLRRHIELNPSDKFTYNETARGEKLYALTHELRIDGFMRMGAGFENLACDISSSGIYETFVSNVTEPGSYVNETQACL
jgi:hypothetical protein